MFKKRNTKNTAVTVTLDHREVSLPGDASVAAGLLGQGEILSRISPASGEPRSPHCLMGVCCECMMEIDGVKRQACMTSPKAGMVINRGLNGEEINNPADTDELNSKLNEENPK